MTNPQAASINTSTLDAILDLQFEVAWAGEGPEGAPRLQWWRTDLVDLDGGGSVFKRLVPRTHRWVALEAAREAARLIDAEARQTIADPDSARSLFFWGFEIDELLADRLRERKMALETAPEFSQFDSQQLEKQWKQMAQVRTEILPSGRQILSKQPDDYLQAAKMLVAALTPFAENYPLPFFRVTTK